MLGETVEGQVKVTESQSVKALLLAATILEQPRSTAMLFQRDCSFTLPPVVIGDRMSGVSNAPLSSVPLVIRMITDKIKEHSTRTCHITVNERDDVGHARTLTGAADGAK